MPPRRPRAPEFAEHVLSGAITQELPNAELIYTSGVAPSHPLKGYFGAGLDNAGLTSASVVAAN